MLVSFAFSWLPGWLSIILKTLQEFLNIQSWQGDDLEQEETSAPAWKGHSSVLGWSCFADVKRAFLSVLFPDTRWRDAVLQQMLRHAFSRTSLQHQVPL